MCPGGGGNEGKENVQASGPPKGRRARPRVCYIRRPGPPRELQTSVSDLERLTLNTWQYVRDNSDTLSDLGTFLSALTALVVAVVALRQLRLNAKQVEAAEAQVRLGRLQVGVATDALAEAQQARLDRYAPRVSILPAGGERTSITDWESTVIGSAAFVEENVAKPPKRFPLRAGHALLRYSTLHFSSNLRVENHGSSTALISADVLVEWDQPLQADERGRYLLPPGEHRILTWFESKLLDRHLEKHDRDSKPTEKPYIDERFSIMVGPATQEAVKDYFEVSFTCLPVFDIPTGSDQFTYDGEQPHVHVSRGARHYDV